MPCCGYHSVFYFGNRSGGVDGLGTKIEPRFRPGDTPLHTNLHSGFRNHFRQGRKVEEWREVNPNRNRKG